MRFEAWTRPDTGSFTRIMPLRDVSGWMLQKGIFGHGSVTIPTDHPSLDQILFVDPTDHSLDKSSLIRAYSGDTHYYDFYAQRMTIQVNETGQRVATVTGTGPGLALDHTIVLPKDYDTNPSLEPDWVWGPSNELLTNEGFEDDTPDEDFEDLSIGGWSELSGTGPDGVAWEELDSAPVASNTEANGGAYSLQIGFGDAPSGASRSLTVLPGARIQVSYVFKEPTGSGDRYLMFAAVDTGAGGTIHSANGWIYNGVAFVELDAAVKQAGASDGTWQTFDMDITVGDTQTVLTLGVQCAGSGDKPTGYLDDGAFTGDGIGLSPWYAHRETDYQTMELSTAFAHSGTHSLKFQTTSMADGEARDGPSQYVFCEVGTQYDLTAWIYHASGSDEKFRVGMKARESGWTAGLADVTVATATWTKIGCNGTAGQEAYEFTVRWVNDTGGAAASPVFYVDDCGMGIGEAASTFGEIMGTLLDDAGTNHAPDRTALAWLTTTFTDSLDSDSVAWDQDLQTTVNRGQTMRRVVAFHQDTFGYEARIRPDPADHTDIQLDLFNPDAMGTDWTLTDGGAITRSGVVSVGPVIRREPLASYAMVEGRDQTFGEDRDTVIEGTWGELETYAGSEEYLSGKLDTIAAGLTTGVEAETVVVAFQNPTLTPGVDYDLGDFVTLTLGDSIVTSAKYRVVDITVGSGDPEPVFQVQFVTEGT